MKDTLRLQIGNKLHDYNVRGEDNTYLTDYILSLIEEEKNKYQPLDTEVMRSKFFAECRANTEFQRELAKKSKGER